MRGWWLGVVAIVGCGPRIDAHTEGSTDGATSTSEGSSPSSAASVSASEAEATTRGDASTSDASTTGDTLATTSAGSTSDESGSSSTGEPEIVEIEGLIEANDYHLFHPCSDLTAAYHLAGGSDEVWACDGAYARVRGQFLDCPGGCLPLVFEVIEVLEARLCETTDCGGTTCAAFDCVDLCSYGAGGCVGGQKCVPWAPPGMPYAGTRCVEVVDDPVALGEPCHEDAASPWVDDCEAPSICVGVDPDTGVGTCASTCSEDGDCDDTCVRANEGAFGICVPHCNPLAPDCPAEHECLTLDDSFGCVPTRELPLLEKFPCEDELTCDDTSLCTEGDNVPGCATAACCTGLCDVLAPECAVGQTCVALQENPPPELVDLGICVVP